MDQERGADQWTGVAWHGTAGAHHTFSLAAPRAKQQQRLGVAASCVASGEHTNDDVFEDVAVVVRCAGAVHLGHRKGARHPQGGAEIAGHVSDEPRVDPLRGFGTTSKGPPEQRRLGGFRARPEASTSTSTSDRPRARLRAHAGPRTRVCPARSPPCAALQGSSLKGSLLSEQC